MESETLYLDKPFLRNTRPQSDGQARKEAKKKGNCSGCPALKQTNFGPTLLLCSVSSKSKGPSSKVQGAASPSVKHI